ncbi:MAG: Hsp20/alpha crystallin family protein [Vicinamibacteria bacterium]
MTLVRTHPFQDVAFSQRRLNRFLSEAFAAQSEGGFVPAVDIRSDASDALLIEVDLPGVPKDAVSVNIENRTLTIKGERKRDLVENDKEGQIQRTERAFGAFARAFTLPESADVTKVTADYKDGVLTIAIPRAEESKPRAIEVKVA